MIKDTFSQFGKNFQIKVLSVLLTDKLFINQISGIITDEYFDSDSLKYIFNTIKDYFDEYRELPTVDVMALKVKAIKEEILKPVIISDLKSVYKGTQSKDHDYIKNEAKTFCQNQVLKKAVLNSVTLLEEGKYEEIKTEIDEAMKVSLDRDLGHDYNNDIEERYNKTLRKCIETPWPPITEITDGGLGKGELGVIVGPPGSGKSWLLANIGAQALRLGKNVIHYTLELGREQTGLRYDSILTGIPSQDLKYYKEDVKEKLKELNLGKLKIQYYPTSTVGVNTLKAHTSRVTSLEFKPHLIIVDYGDLLTTHVVRGKENSYHTGGTIYEDLRGFAGEVEVPLWTASQAGREGETVEVIEGNQIAESYKKIMVADYIMSLSRRIEDSLQGTGRVFIIKNRNGPDKLTLPAKIDIASGHFQIFSPTTIDGIEQTGKMKSGEDTIRKLLSENYKEIQREKKLKEEKKNQEV